MKKTIFLAVAFLIFSSHDMYLKMGTYFLQPNTPSTIKLFNGTFDKSENVITRNRMNDVSLVGNGTRSKVDTSQWSEINNITVLNFTTGEAGTWIAGVSTNPNNIEISAKEFNEYLEHDGVLDMLDWRKQNNALDQDAVEKYSKHVKTIFQVGDKKTDDWQTVLGYPIEFVPMSNPYDAHAGDNLSVKLLWKGQPLPNQLVYVGSDAEGHGHSHESGDAHSHEAEHEHSDRHEHDHDEAHAHDHDAGHSHDHDAETEEAHHHDATQLRTDANGIVTMSLSNEGQWYLRTIYMEQVEEAGLTHESNWATLTFEVGHGHSHTDGEHTHEDGTTHSHGGIPAWAYWIGGLLLAGLLFFVLRRKT